MQHSNINATHPIDNRLVLERFISFLNMANSISKKSSIKASSAKPLGKPTPGDKTFGVYPGINFYAIEDKDETKKGEKVEILVV